MIEFFVVETLYLSENKILKFQNYFNHIMDKRIVML